MMYVFIMYLFVGMGRMEEHHRHLSPTLAACEEVRKTVETLMRAYDRTEESGYMTSECRPTWEGKAS